MVEERPWSACTCDVLYVYNNSDIGIYDKANVNKKAAGMKLNMTEVVKKEAVWKLHH